MNDLILTSDDGTLHSAVCSRQGLELSPKGLQSSLFVAKQQTESVGLTLEENIKKIEYEPIQIFIYNYWIKEIETSMRPPPPPPPPSGKQ